MFTMCVRVCTYTVVCVHKIPLETANPGCPPGRETEWRQDGGGGGGGVSDFSLGAGWYLLKSEP